MTAEEKLDVIGQVVHCCFSKGRCLDCPFYEFPCNGHPGKCMGMKRIGPLLERYVKELKEEWKKR